MGKRFTKSLLGVSVGEGRVFIGLLGRGLPSRVVFIYFPDDEDDGDDDGDPFRPP